MADGSIKIVIEVDGKQVNIASDSLDDLEAAAKGAGKGAKQTEEGFKGIDKESSKANRGIKELVTSFGLLKIGEIAFKSIKNAMDGAISRFDIMNKFPKVLQSLGVSADDSERSVKNLSEATMGLPTRLDDIAATAQRMYVSFKNMDMATDSAIALNNALLASGSVGEAAASGTEQYIQALQKGKPDMMEWRNMQQNMSVALDRIAQQYGITVDQLGNALRSGEIPMESFNQKMIELGTGAGELVEMAKTGSTGLATSLNNLKNAAIPGLTGILESFNKLSKEVTGMELAEHIDSLKLVVYASFRAIGGAIEATAPIIIAFSSGIKATIPIVNALTPAILGLMAAYATYTIITRVSDAIKASNAILEAAQASQKALTIVMKAQTTTQVANTTAKNIDAVATAAQTGAIGLSNVAIGLLTGKMKLSTVATIAKTAATTALSTAMKVLSGPVGWVTLGIGALVTGAIALVKWFKRSTEEGEELKKKTNELSDEIEETSNSIEQSSKIYKEQTTETRANARAQEDLMKQIIELSEKENKSAADKQLLADKIQQLNMEVEGLGLAYNEESNSLNLSNEQMKTRIGLQEEQSRYIDANERLLEISKEQYEIDAKLEETNELKKQNQKLYDEGAITREEFNVVTDKLTEAEKELKEAHSQLGVEYEIVESQASESMDKMQKALESGAISQAEMIDAWVAKNEELVSDMRNSYEEIYGITTDAFDRINNKSKLSAEDMIENLKHNQKVMAEWGDNISELMGFASEHGHDNFLHWLENLGPDSAAEIAVINQMSDTQLEEFARTMEKGADVSTEAFGKSLGEGMEESAKVLGDHITGLSDTMQSAARDADFGKVGQDVVEGYLGGIKDSTPKAEKATSDMAKKSTDSAKQALGVHSPSRVFKEIGTNITEGLVLGINGGTSKVIQAVKNMFKQVQSNSTQSFNGITRSYDNAINQIDRSLARLPNITQRSMTNMSSTIQIASTAQINALRVLAQNYDREVDNIDKSLSKLPGIAQKSMKSTNDRLKSGASTNVQVMTKLSRDLVSPFNSLRSQFNSIGVNAMNGLNAGLNAGRARVLATARSIANSITSTMQSSLRIHSPSRVMEDDVGRWIPEGVAEGIKGKASVVYDAINKISSNMMRFSTPEMALGISGMRANAATISHFNSKSTTKTINNDNKPTIHIEKIENYSDTDVPRVLEESAWIMDREKVRLDG